MSSKLLSREERNKQVKATGFVYCSSGHLVERASFYLCSFEIQKGEMCRG